MTLPRVCKLQQQDCHRFIPSRYSPNDESVLYRIADDAHHLEDLFDLDHATNDRLLAENDRLLEVGRDELVFNIPYCRVINASFTHAQPLGSRFNSPERGAWYAGFAAKTCELEVAWHKSVELSEINWWNESVTYDDYLSDFAGEFHDIRGDPTFLPCLDPNSYIHSQLLATSLLAQGSSGLIYPSVRDKNGTCIVCFRPALVHHVRKHARYRFTWDGQPSPSIVLETTY